MARRIPGELVALALLLAPAAVAAAGDRARPPQEPDFAVLAAHGFEEGTDATGPDTFRVFAEARGRVVRTPLFRYAGDSAIEVRDVAGDRAFPELQGYFELRGRGLLAARFALLVADPAEPFNVALAGPASFRLAPHGIAFWLKNRGGSFVHVSDGIPKRLAPIEPFVWYLFEVLYDVDRGSYGLTVRREGLSEPVAALAGQPNATSQPGSAVDKFSFIGDTGEDLSNAVYYVDEIAIGAAAPGETIAPPPFVAPGRRHLFVETLGEPAKLAARQFLCLPAWEARDLGLDEPALAAMPPAERAELERRLLGGQPGEAGPAATDLLRAVAEWRRGCAALASDHPEEALPRFAEALRLRPGARIFRLAEVLGLGRTGRTAQAAEELAQEAAAWAGDPRFAVASAMAAAARGDLDEALAWTRGPAERLGASRPPSPDRPGRTDLVPPAARRFLEASLWADEHYHLLAAAGRLAEAAAFAARMRSVPGMPAAQWLEREADAALLAGDAAAAQPTYRRALDLAGADAPSALLLKLADACFLLGDLPGEKALRERIYGTLDPRP